MHIHKYKIDSCMPINKFQCHIKILVGYFVLMSCNIQPFILVRIMISVLSWDYIKSDWNFFCNWFFHIFLSKLFRESKSDALHCSASKSNLSSIGSPSLFKPKVLWILLVHSALSSKFSTVDRSHSVEYSLGDKTYSSPILKIS